MKNNKKGFTLIELLAVIVILGVVMAIAIPSMQKIIDNSKKDTLISTAQEYINGAKTMLTSENSLPDYGHATVISVDDISLDRGGKSPYTSTAFESANSFVIVVNEATADNASGSSLYTYYIKLVDNSKNCLVLKSEKDLNNKARVTRDYIQSGDTNCKIQSEKLSGASQQTLNIDGKNVTVDLYN